MASEVSAWRELTKGSFNFHTLPGDHLFLLENQDQKQLLELISHDLEKYKWITIFREVMRWYISPVLSPQQPYIFVG